MTPGPKPPTTKECRPKPIRTQEREPEEPWFPREDSRGSLIGFYLGMLGFCLPVFAFQGRGERSFNTCWSIDGVSYQLLEPLQVGAGRTANWSLRRPKMNLLAWPQVRGCALASKHVLTARHSPGQSLLHDPLVRLPVRANSCSRWLAKRRLTLTPFWALVLFALSPDSLAQPGHPQHEGWEK